MLYKIVLEHIYKGGLYKDRQVQLYIPEDDFPKTKETFTCEACSHLNITKVKNIDTRVKRIHMLKCDDLLWAKLKREAAAFKTISDFLAFILKFYLAHKEENFNVV